MRPTEINTREGRWVLNLNANGTVEVIKFTAAPPRKKWDGLGDVIASATKAVGFKPCGSCEERRKMLNGMMPFGTAEQAAAAAPKIEAEQPQPDAAPK